jgi:hypothetical protein
MRHGSHGCACFRPFADYRKREETKQPGKTGLFVQVGRRVVSRLLRAMWAVPRQTATRSSGVLGNHPSPPLPDHSVGRSIWPLRAHGRSWSIPSLCVPDDRDPLDHKLLTVQALLVPFGASRWHGERGTLH